MLTSLVIHLNLVPVSEQLGHQHYNRVDIAYIHVQLCSLHKVHGGPHIPKGKPVYVLSRGKIQKS